MYIDLCIFIYYCIRIYIHTTYSYIIVYVYIYIHTYSHIYTAARTHTLTHTHTLSTLNAGEQVNKRIIDTHISVCVYINICIYYDPNDLLWCCLETGLSYWAQRPSSFPHMGHGWVTEGPTSLLPCDTIPLRVPALSPVARGKYPGEDWAGIRNTGFLRNQKLTFVDIGQVSKQWLAQAAASAKTFFRSSVRAR